MTLDFASYTAIGSVAFQLLCGAVAAALQTEKFFDLCGALNFLAVAAYGLGDADGDWRQRAVALMYAVWALRLGTFLFARALKNGGDSRFDELKKRPAKFMAAWFLQAVWVVATTLPLLMLGEQADSEHVDRFPSTELDAVGLALFVGGIVCEVVADIQKWRFKSDESRDESFISTGLWRYSRHPNYFGEIVLQLGIFLSAVSGLDGAGYIVGGAIAPVFVAFLLIFVSGIPTLEKKKEDDPDYRRYQEATSILVPWPPKFDWRARARSDS